jgi:vanillate O-demethylase monooxygenase subunit
MAVEEFTGNALDEAGEFRLHRAMRRFWHPVMRAMELTDQPAQVTLLETQLVLARLDGTVVCFPDLCVHRGSALSLGWVDGGQLRCRYHGWTYGADGVCTSIPARFGTNIPRRARLHPYLVAERHGLIWVCLEPEPGLPIPDFPEFDDPAFRVHAGPTYDWRSSAHRRMENFIDWSHFAWVHDGTLGRRDEPETPDAEVERDERGLRFGGHFREPVAGSPESIDARYDYHLLMPLTCHIVRLTAQGDADRYVLWMTASPLGPKLCRSFWYIARNAPDDQDESYLAWEDRILAEDRPVVESQRPEMLPADLSAELHIRGIDKASLDYRRWLIELSTSTPVA